MARSEINRRAQTAAVGQRRQQRHAERRREARQGAEDDPKNHRGDKQDPIVRVREERGDRSEEKPNWLTISMGLLRAECPKVRYTVSIGGPRPLQRQRDQEAELERHAREERDRQADGDGDREAVPRDSPGATRRQLSRASPTVTRSAIRSSRIVRRSLATGTAEEIKEEATWLRTRRWRSGIA